MNTLEFTVSGNHLELSADAISTEGCVNYDRCGFTFDSEWDGFERTAVFETGGDSFRVVLEDDACFIPSPCVEKEGLIRIGVYGTNNDTVIATNSVAHRIDEGISGLGEWFEEDYSLVLNAVKNMETRVARSIADVNENFEAIRSFVLSGSNATASVSGGDCPDEWYKPNDFNGAENIREVISSGNIQEFYDYGFEPLRTRHPDYITREFIGTDSDGELPVYAYTFAPVDYEKTVFLTSCVHGYGRTSFFALSNFFKELCENYASSRVLSYLRNRVKIIVVPAVSTLGLVTGRGLNANNVDIGFNFPYRWEDCDKTTKGAAPADQAETQNIIDYVEVIHMDKLCAAIDFHVDTDTESGKSIFYPRFKNNCLSALTKFVNTFNYEAESGAASKGILAATVKPSISDYLADEYGINTCEAVWHYRLFGGNYSNENYTKFTEYIANLVYTMAKNSSFTCKCGPAPFAKYIAWRSTDEAYGILNSSTPKKIGISDYELSLDTPCILELRGCVVLNVTTPCTVKINPLLYQVNSPEQDYDDRTTNSPFMLELPLTAGTHVIPVNSVLQAFYTSYNATSKLKYCENVCVSLAVCADTASAAEVKAFTLNIVGIPSDTAKPVVISTPMGRPSDYTDEDVPVQQIVYPLETYTYADSQFSD